MSHTILYVEDETAIIELVQDVLDHPQITLLTATTGYEGIKIVQDKRPNLVLLDVMMPDTDGWKLYYQIRGDEQLAQTPIIMLTGMLHRYRIMKEFAQSPIDAYITKPFDALALRIEVQKMLKTPFWPELMPLTAPAAQGAPNLLPSGSSAPDGDTTSTPSIN